MARRENSEINAGSMADIAFLLLIFFLVTTTMDTDSGVFKTLAEKPPENYTPPKIKEKNVLEVNISRDNRLLIDEEIVELKDVRSIAKDFIDNGAGTDKKQCGYCEGKKDPASSDLPGKAIISVQTAMTTDYGMYIAVQNELLAAYEELRNNYAKKYLKGRYRGMSFTEMSKLYNADKQNLDLKKAITEVKDAYPQILADAEPIK